MQKVIREGVDDEFSGSDYCLSGQLRVGVHIGEPARSVWFGCEFEGIAVTVWCAQGMDQARDELPDLFELLVCNSDERIDFTIGRRERCRGLLLLCDRLCERGLHAEPTCWKRLSIPTLPVIAATNLSGTPL